jgi:hypothetical protein
MRLKLKAKALPDINNQAIWKSRTETKCRFFVWLLATVRRCILAADRWDGCAARSTLLLEAFMYFFDKGIY